MHMSHMRDFGLGHHGGLFRMSGSLHRARNETANHSEVKLKIDLKASRVWMPQELHRSSRRGDAGMMFSTVDAYAPIPKHSLNKAGL